MRMARDPCYRSPPAPEREWTMAIDAPDLFLLLREAKERPFHGAILTFGRQDVTVDAPSFRRLAARLRVREDALLPDRPGPLTDGEVLRALGFSDVQSLDVNAYEGAGVLHDLNSPDVPPAACGRYDVVFDRGTSEHVFHTPNMFVAAARLARAGGRIIHLSPSTNHLDHGFFMFTPGLFEAFYSANGFEIERLELVRYPWLDRRPTIESYRYDASRPCAGTAGRLDEAAYQVFCVARKTSSSTADRLPLWREDGLKPSAPGHRARGLRPDFPLASRTSL